MFRWVFASLPAKSRIYPTENYYYFSFFAGARLYWGNLRLGVEDRSCGGLHFVYWEYIDDPKRPDESPVWSRTFGSEDGVAIRRLTRTLYSVRYRGRRVTFQLTALPYGRPRRLRLRACEKLVARTQDESGFRFFLIFRTVHRHFMWVLDEDGSPAVTWEPLHKDVVVDKLSGFVFYVDSAVHRKVLVGVAARNVRRNNYWDGPFDQLSDNYVHRHLVRYMQQAYPYLKGRIDRFGKFVDQPGFRLAITPYLEYESFEEVRRRLSNCRKHAREEFFACIAYDYKTSYR